MHLHTCFSHGVPSPLEIHLLATRKNYSLIGFSEHSPRPSGYDYTREYRFQLERHWDDYCRQVLALRESAKENRNSCQVLFGMEMDWLTGEEEFVRAAAKSNDFDYLLGSVHFIGNWGFDDKEEDWADLSQEECDSLYERYFENWSRMLDSGLFHIASHPDLIKIFSVERFRIWLDKPRSRIRIYSALKILKDRGMAIEISSAGLRKPCREIYPAPPILQMAKELGLPVAFASDAHTLADFGYGFDELEKLADEYGWREQAFFQNGKINFVSL